MWEMCWKYSGTLRLLTKCVRRAHQGRAAEGIEAEQLDPTQIAAPRPANNTVTL